jgi:hypothetical protein
MANLKIFLSSTCYDLGVVRSQLRNFLIGLGYEPILSEFSDILFDPRLHTHTSCIQEVTNCDMNVLIVGSRFGGAAIPKAVEVVEVDKLRELSAAEYFAEDKSTISVTQLEVLQAIQSGVPIFTFVDSGVLNDHLTYEKNKHKAILKDIEFPHIDKQETAVYIFEFINFLRLRAENNSIIEFSKLEDIESHLKKQWSALFQRLLYEQRTKESEARRIDYIANQIADIKTAIMTSISSAELKETAKGAIKFRMLIDFIYGLGIQTESVNLNDLLNSNIDWATLMSTLRIVEIRPETGSSLPHRVVLIRDDNTYYRANWSLASINRLPVRWDEFRQLNPEVRVAIITAVTDNLDTRPMAWFRHVEEPYPEIIPAASKEEDDDDEIPF